MHIKKKYKLYFYFLVKRKNNNERIHKKLRTVVMLCRISLNMRHKNGIKNSHFLQVLISHFYRS